MATLKNMTRVGADVRQIARLLQAKAPENHMLAYITPEEAQLLKNRGGSGMPDPDTGIPSFQEENFSYDMYGETATPEYMPQYQTNYPEEFRGSPTSTASQIETAPVVSRYVEPSVTVMDSGPSTISAPYQEDELDKQFREAGIRSDYFPQYAGKFGEVVNPYAATQEAVSFEAVKQPPATLGQKYKDLANYLGIAPEMLGKIGIAGISSLYGAYQAKQARDDAAAAKRQQEALAIPYQTKGQELQRQAQAGELTAVGQQQLKAVQAQAAQSASARGGVGAQQAQMSAEAFRQQLLQNQYDLGLKVSGIGDNIAMGAIKTGLEADRYVNQLTTNYYNNITRAAYGQAPQVAGSPTYVRVEA